MGDRAAVPRVRGRGRPPGRAAARVVGRPGTQRTRRPRTVGPPRQHPRAARRPAAAPGRAAPLGLAAGRPRRVLGRPRQVAAGPAPPLCPGRDAGPAQGRRAPGRGWPPAPRGPAARGRPLAARPDRREVAQARVRGQHGSQVWRPEGDRADRQRGRLLQGQGQQREALRPARAGQRAGQRLRHLPVPAVVLVLRGGPRRRHGHRADERRRLPPGPERGVAARPRADPAQHRARPRGLLHSPQPAKAVRGRAPGLAGQAPARHQGHLRRRRRPHRGRPAQPAVRPGPHALRSRPHPDPELGQAAQRGLAAGHRPLVAVQAGRHQPRPGPARADQLRAAGDQPARRRVRGPALVHRLLHPRGHLRGSKPQGQGRRRPGVLRGPQRGRGLRRRRVSQDRERQEDPPPQGHLLVSPGRPRPREERLVLHARGADQVPDQVHAQRAPGSAGPGPERRPG
ncbi:hypothetical protein ENSA7_75690 [Enhygromyxa salina]|uniref:Uncharacterized protein n=1 Tax=Enhygromyxa salina TaxID=215803 RepID=A0A2S9XQX1_9BACT|nr:hypothetical protein ENSA7_75690 [Enhygromyxa salina]